MEKTSYLKKELLLMKLRLGKMKASELAEWFNISPKSYSNSKKKKLKELEVFADFEEVNGGVIIKKIYNEEYSKQGSENYQKVRNKVDEVWNENGLDTCSRVGGEVYEILIDEDKNFKLTNSTVINYTLRSRNELWGKPFMGGGTKGECTYLWCKRDKETGEYSFLNEEEQKIKQQLQMKYFGDATEKQIMVKAMIEAGEIKEEEAWKVLEEMTNMGTGNFMGFLQELQRALGGCQVVKGTLVKRSSEESAWIEG